MAKAKVINVDIRNDGSVVAYYDTGSTKAFKSVEATPKTVKTWLDTNAPAPVTVQATETGIVMEVQEQVKQLPILVEAAPVAVQTQAQPEYTTETVPADYWRDMEPNWLWMVPTVPLMFAWWAVMYAWAGVTMIGKIVGLAEAVRPHIVEGIRFIRAWWKQSAGFRAELIQEYRLADWEVA